MKAISEETEQFSILRRLVLPPGISGASACNAKPCIAIQKQSKVKNKPVVVFQSFPETIHCKLADMRRFWRGYCFLNGLEY